MLARKRPVVEAYDVHVTSKPNPHVLRSESAPESSGSRARPGA
jgi:hypothetical protein